MTASMPQNEFHELAQTGMQYGPPGELTLEALHPALDALAPGDVEQKLGATNGVRPAAPARHTR